jgi:putative ABC transport system permease protein
LVGDAKLLGNFDHALHADLLIREWTDAENERIGGVLDRLILTDTASVWKVHEDYTAEDAQDRAAMEEEREVTMALVRYRTPLAAVSFPRWVNASTEMQAAAPALEVTRLLHMLGLGTDVLRAFAGLLLLTAGLGVFIALWNAVRERRADLALLRMLGAAPAKMAALLVTEALWLGLLASVLGLALGQLFIILAYKHASAAQIAPFNYSVVIFSGIIGWMVWHAALDLVALLGIAFVCVGGIASILYTGKTQTHAFTLSHGHGLQKAQGDA